MQILNVVSAKSIWLFDINDLNPRGKDVNSELFEWLQSNYYFEKFPNSVNDLDPQTKGLKFEQGRFQIKEEIYIAVDLEIFNDGVVANSRSSTKDTDTFLEDFLSQAAKEFSLTYDLGMIRTKMHASELTIRMGAVMFDLNPRLVSFSNQITAMCGLHVPPFEPTLLGFSTDLAISPLKPAPFVLERKAGFPFAEGRYYSKAPVHTSQHQELLVELEQILHDPATS